MQLRKINILIAGSLILWLILFASMFSFLGILFHWWLVIFIAGTLYMAATCDLRIPPF